MTNPSSSDSLFAIGKLAPAARVPLAPPRHVCSLDAVVKEFVLDGGVSQRVLDGVDLAVARGEFVSLLGPAGCGKSTLLRLVAGVDEPTAGTVEVGRQNPIALSQRTGCCVMTADDQLDPDDTLEANVAAPHEVAGRRAQGAQVAELLDFLGLTMFAGAPAGELSAEVRQRAALARALVLRPKILLLDSAFSQLEPEARWRLNADLKSICARRGVAAMLVADDLDDIVFLSDRVVVMTTRPARVDHIVTIDLDQPRHPAMVLSAPFRRAVRQLEQVLDHHDDTLDLR